MPERRAASRAVARASGLIPFTLHGTPSFILTHIKGRRRSSTVRGEPVEDGERTPLSWA
jgi:hypothetical protein